MNEMKKIKTKSSWNKSDLTVMLSNEAQIPKVRAAQYINILTDMIAEALEKGKKVTISDFGTFQVSQRRSFKGRNPKTGDPLKVPVRRIPVFRAGKRLKTSLNVPQVKSCALVDVRKVKLVFSKVMDEGCTLLYDKEAYNVLIDERNVGPITNIEVGARSVISRNGKDIEGITSVILTCSGSLRGKRLEVVFKKELADIDGNNVEID
jgi:integration host factor subunit beta